MIELIFFSAIAIGLVYYFMGKGKTAKASPGQTTQTKSNIEELSEDDEEVDVMLFDVVGESFKNEDGCSRQEIIEKYAKEYNPVHLKFYNYKGELACGVYLDEKHKQQIGNIGRSEAEDIYELATNGSTIDPRIYSVNKGPKGLYGVVIQILSKDN